MHKIGEIELSDNETVELYEFPEYILIPLQKMMLEAWWSSLESLKAEFPEWDHCLNSLEQKD